jgi:cholest-4-en-3-one 26-monooxygenase
LRFDFSRDLDQFVEGTPHEIFAELRSTCRVKWFELPARPGAADGFWLVTGYREVLEVSKNVDAFSSNLGTLLVDHPPANAKPPWSMIKSEFCSLDPPVHTEYRTLIAPAFGQHAIAQLESAMRTLASDLFERALQHEAFDFAEELAVPFPVTVVLGHLLGIPKEDHARASYWSDVLSAPEDPHFMHAPNAALRAVHEMYDYACQMAQDRRANPRKDLASMLALTRMPDGTLLSDEVFSHYFWSMILGSFDTTASTLAGGTLALIESPEMFEKLRQKPHLLESAIEEMLRWVSPVVYFRRTATRDVVLGGQEIKKGQRVALCYPSANRDESVFANPNTFDIERTPNPHVAFGFGRHFCLGARLARLELKVFFEEMLRRDVCLEKRGAVVRARSNFLNRIHTFPVGVRRRNVSAS